MAREASPLREIGRPPALKLGADAVDGLFDRLLDEFMFRAAFFACRVRRQVFVSMSLRIGRNPRFVVGGSENLRHPYDRPMRHAAPAIADAPRVVLGYRLADRRQNLFDRCVLTRCACHHCPKLRRP